MIYGQQKLNRYDDDDDDDDDDDGYDDDNDDDDDEFVVKLYFNLSNNVFIIIF